MIQLSIRMKKRGKVLAIAAAVLVVIIASAWFFVHHTFPVLQPSGEVGDKERNLIVFTVALSTVVVVPVFVLLAVFAIRYREGGGGKYDGKLEGNRKAEIIWWAIPAVLIFIIATVTWRSSHALDPFKQLGDNTLHIQVVALDWKWLFIYPGDNIARVNVVDIPAGQPVEFDITSDTVMTSFWVPSLGGQMYAMPGMQTKLNLEAKAGNYNGVAANISGEGFADMTFTVHALPPAVYDDWVQTMHHVPNRLTTAEYDKLAKPSTLSPADVGMGKQYTYGGVQPALYDTVINKYMTPSGSTE